MMARWRLVLFLGWSVLVYVTPAQAVRFAMVSDTQEPYDNGPYNPRIFPLIVDNILKADPPVEFVIVTGDLTGGTGTEQGQRDQFLAWRQAAAPWYQSNMAGCKVYCIPGNHDLRDPQDMQVWQQVFSELPDNGPDDEKKMTYSFDAGPCHIVALQTYRPPNDYRVNVDWLARDLAASTAPVKLVFGHAPAYPFLLMIKFSLDLNPEARDQFWDTLAANHVPAYFCGHEHIFERWMHRGVQQITSGGGGGFSGFFHYLIIDADEQDVTVSVYQDTGKFYEKFRLSDTQGVSTVDRTDPNRKISDTVTCLQPFLALAPLLTGGFGLLIRRME